MNRLQKLHTKVASNFNFYMVKNVIGGGTQNLLDKKEKRIDRR